MGPRRGRQTTPTPGPWPSQWVGVGPVCTQCPQRLPQLSNGGWGLVSAHPTWLSLSQLGMTPAHPAHWLSRHHHRPRQVVGQVSALPGGWTVGSSTCREHVGGGGPQNPGPGSLQRAHWPGCRWRRGMGALEPGGLEVTMTPSPDPHVGDKVMKGVGICPGSHSR